MVRNFVPLTYSALEDFGILGGVFADDKKRHLHVVRREEIEQLWS